MPSARELLEQADALMQKNRARVDADIPVLVDAIASPPLSALADVPVLTDVVEKVVLMSPLPSPAPPVKSAGLAFDGDPSDWLVMDTIDPSMHSITGGAPDTLGIVPPFSTKAMGSARTPPPARSTPPQKGAPLLDALGLPVRWSEDDVESGAAPFDDRYGDDADAAPRDDEHGDAHISDGSTLPHAASGVAAPATHAEATNDAAMEVVDRSPHDAADGAAVEATTVAAPQSVIVAHELLAVVTEDAGAEMGTLEQFDALALAMPESTHDSDTEAMARAQEASEAQALAAAAKQADDAEQLRLAEVREEERWQALAEQISMQVLQRVDLFTDEGLKDQLADRLQPIVARASAQLVETVTDHVGQLLRTYVAEAIEREIAAWRQGQR